MNRYYYDASDLLAGFTFGVAGTAVGIAVGTVVATTTFGVAVTATGVAAEVCVAVGSFVIDVVAMGLVFITTGVSVISFSVHPEKMSNRDTITDAMSGCVTEEFMRDKKY